MTIRNLVLAPDATVDLHIHTTYSDGAWTPAELFAYAASQQFALLAITDHDRPDTAFAIQQLACEAYVPTLTAAEMTASWRGELVDVLCYGFAPDQQALTAVAQDVARRQQENTRAVYEQLCRTGQLDPDQTDELQALLDAPSAKQPHVLIDLVHRYNFGVNKRAAERLVLSAGCVLANTGIATVVDAAHRSGAVCLLAHPGRGNGFLRFDAALMDDLRREVPIDGLEVFYPLHTPEQTAHYREYAQRHRLLVSAGSDAHGPAKPPFNYRADLSRILLEHLGIELID